MNTGVTWKRWAWVAMLVGVALVFVGCANRANQTIAVSAGAQGEAGGPSVNAKNPLLDNAVPSEGTSSTARTLLAAASGSEAVGNAITDDQQHAVVKVWIEGAAGASTTTFTPFGLLLAPDIELWVGRGDPGWTPQKDFTVVTPAEHFSDGRKYAATVGQVGGIDVVEQAPGAQNVGDTTNQIKARVSYQISGHMFDWLSSRLSLPDLQRVVSPVVQASLSATPSSAPSP